MGGDLTSAFLDEGLSGNEVGSSISATAVYFSTNRLIQSFNKYTLNNASLGTLCFRAAVSIIGGETAYIGTDNTGRTPMLTPVVSPAYNAINSFVTRTSANFSGTGLMILNRTSNTSVDSIKKNTQIFYNTASSSGNLTGTITALQMGKVYPIGGGTWHTNAGLSLMFTGQSIPYSVSQSVRTTINEKYFRKLGLTEIA